MSFKEKIKSAREYAMKERRENEAFRKIIRERTRAEERRAYQEEALKVAKERGKAKARPVSFTQRVIGISENARRLKQSVAPRRVSSRRSTKRVSPRRVSSVRRNRTIRLTPPSQQQGYKPFSIGDFI